MKKILSLLLALVIVLGVLPFRAEAKTPETILPEGPKPMMPADIGDHSYREVESNDSANLADVVRNDYTVNASLSPYDLIDFFYFELSSRSDVFIVALAQYDSLMYGILDGNADEVLAAGVFDSYSDSGKSFFVLDTTLPAGEYYIIFMDEDDYYNDYTFYTEFTSVGGGHTHNYVYACTVPSTCLSQGYDLYMCDCGAEYETNYQPIGDHLWDEGTVITEPTETSTGVMEYTCLYCAGTRREEIPALEHTHSHIPTVIPPSCTTDGYTVYTCACGDSYVADRVPATGHHFADGSCTVCGAEDPNSTEPIVNPFTDVKESDYFFNPVMWAVENGITSGLNATTFGPNNSCTRAQVVTFLWRANGQPEPTSTNNPFTDVNPGDYFYKPVLWAVENGITAGTSATTFGPNNVCTRGQVVTFLWRASGKPTPASNANPFADVKGADYFFEPVLWAVENGITSGLNATTFGANNSCTRGQVVTFLFRADNIDVPDEPVTPPTEPEEPTEPPTEPTEPPTEPTEPPTEPTEPPTEPTEPSEPGRELQRSEIELELRIPTNGGMNAYTTVRVTNRSDMALNIPSMFTCNGKLVNMDSDYDLDGGYYVDLTFYRAIIPSERYNSKWYDMYLDNNSIGIIVLEWNSDQYYVEFGVNGIVEFYRGNVNGPATDPVGPDPEVPDDPTPPPTEPEEPSDIVFYELHPAVPDLGVVANASLLMGGSTGSYYYSLYDVSNDEMAAYKALLEECGFVFQKTTYGTIIDFDYDTYKHNTMDISVDVGYWRNNPLGNLAVVEVEGSDADKAPSGSGSTEPGMDYYPNTTVVPDFGSWFDAELVDEYGIYNGVCYNYSLELTDELTTDYVALLLEEGFSVQFAFENEMLDYQVFWHPDEDLSVEFGTSLHPEWGWVTFVSIYAGDPRDPGYYSYDDYPVVPDFGSFVGAILLDDPASTKGTGTCFIYDISLYADWAQDYCDLLLNKGFDVQYYTEDTDYYYEVFWHPDADLTVEFGKIDHPDNGWVTFVDVYAGDPAEPDHYGPAPEEPEPTEPENDPLNPDPDDVEPYLTFSGYGDEVITGINLPAGEYYAEYLNDGARNFIVRFYYDDGEYDYTSICNEIGACTGQILLNDTLGQSVSNGMLNVRSSGNWTINIKPVSGTTTTSIRGFGTLITGKFVATSSRTVFNLTHDGSRNFIVRVYQYGSEGDYDSLTNEIGVYNGQKMVVLEQGEEYYFSVRADGNWTIDLGEGAQVTTYVQPDGKGSTGSNPGGGNGGGDYPIGTVIGYECCPYVPDFGAFVGGVEPAFFSLISSSGSYHYKSSEVNAAAGPNALSDYLDLLEDMNFYLAVADSAGLIYKHRTVDLAVSITVTTISSGEYIGVMFYGSAYNYPG